MGDPKPMPRRGNPKAGTCRWCGGARIRQKVTRILFCLKCDAGEVNDLRAGDPTWLKNWRSV